MEVLQYQLNSPSFFWANLSFGTGAEKQEGKQVVGDQVNIFTVRYKPSLSQDQVIEYEGRYYDIEGVKEIGRRKYIALTARQKDNDWTIDILTP